jgi:hypothetical protein
MNEARIAEGEEGWEDMLPEGTPELIKDKQLFGYESKLLESK